MPSDEDKKQQRQAWHLELLAVGRRCPDTNGTISSGAYAAWLALTKDLLQQGAADEVFLVDSIYLVGREIEKA